MKRHIVTIEVIILVFLLLVSIFLWWQSESQSTDPLPAWRNTAIKQKIIQFVETVSNPKSHHYVPEKDRIATFDNDGTLWVEQPMYAQVIFIKDRIKNFVNNKFQINIEKLLADVHKTKFANFNDEIYLDYQTLFSFMFGKMSNSLYHQQVFSWLSKINHPYFHKPYTQ